MKLERGENRYLPFVFTEHDKKLNYLFSKFDKEEQR